MTQTRPLDGLTILDLSSRLPGPLAGHLLAGMGAHVIKVETQTHPDPFKVLKMGTGDVAFQSWYSNMHVNMDNFILSTENSDQLRALCKKAHMVIMGWPTKIQEKYQVRFEDLSGLSQWGSYIEISGSHHHDRPLHDLNVMAEMGLLSLHIKQWEKRSGNKTKRIAPPFLPIAGVTFATQITQRILASSVKALKDQIWVRDSVSLEESLDHTWNPLYAPDLRGVQESFLHSGRYPCYNIYPLKNHRGHLAIACIEEKYWIEFTQAFGLELSPEQRFNDEEEDTFIAIQNCITQYDVDQMREKLTDLNCCLSLIE